METDAEDAEKATSAPKEKKVEDLVSRVIDLGYGNFSR